MRQPTTRKGDLPFPRFPKGWKITQRNIMLLCIMFRFPALRIEGAVLAPPPRSRRSQKALFAREGISLWHFRPSGCGVFQSKQITAIA